MLIQSLFILYLRSLKLLSPFNHFDHLHLSPGNHEYVLYIYELGFVFVFGLDYTCKWENAVFVLSLFDFFRLA